ncbi:formylglycine-generating enzyme family protein [Geobacter sp. OR-1]|uniref:formylglycine-generating enzyme family protein n=1 Tax=Geobacter sp. OR-1 TaxID=1266765 RepID=UPI002351E969|nr:formylglycine-generating enzyme family protein [Geobacter sp. OR-1]
MQLAACAGHGHKGLTGELLGVPAGCFQMGDGFGDGYFNEYPQHEVCLNRFLISKYAVTRGDFRTFVAETGFHTEAEKGEGCYTFDRGAWKKVVGASWLNPGFSQNDDHPVVCVTWNDAVAYSEWLSGKTGLACRLPTEAEWEYAARSGGKSEKYAGSNDVDAVAWYSVNSGTGTRPAGTKQPNGLGLYDMSGNVWQWTADWYGEKYYRESPINNPTGPAVGTNKVYRGGSWFYDQKGIRVSYRDFFLPGFRSSQLGFRPVCSGK